MKSDFTNNMTHELKTPLAVAYSAIDTLLNFKQGENRDKRNQYLQICIEQLSHLSGLVEQILYVSMERTKKITLNKETVELKPFIAQIAGNHTLKANKPVDIHIDIQPETLSVHADATHLNNIINNLIDNAVKYATSEEAVEITVASYMEKEFCILSVKDNGMGISPENQKLIFDRFYRVPQGNLHDIKGFGLGLSYVKSIVERHGGCITVKSALHKGAEFIIKIPQR
jgi:signal transduction histidine kinase